MTVSIHIDGKTGVAIATCSGVLPIDEARRSVAALWKTPGWHGRKAVWDFRNAEFDLSTSEAKDLARFVLEHQPESPPEKVAFVTQRDVDFGMARVFEVFREDSRTAVHVFRDYDEAVLWASSMELEPAL